MKMEETKFKMTLTTDAGTVIFVGDNEEYLTSDEVVQKFAHLMMGAGWSALNVYESMANVAEENLEMFKRKKLS
jgi:hypothetical protein